MYRSEITVVKRLHTQYSLLYKLVHYRDRGTPEECLNGKDLKRLREALLVVAAIIINAIAVVALVTAR
jgi:hypothetical protein